MAHKGDSESDFNPKHRIVGAIIVVSLAVIFLPMIFDDESSKPELSKTARQLERIPEADAETEVFRLPAASLAQTKPQSPTVVDDERLEESSRVQTPDKTAVATSTRKDDTKASSTAVHTNRPLRDLAQEGSTAKDKAETVALAETPASTDAPKGWVIQVGTFSNSDNAQRLRDKLRQSGFLVNLEDVHLRDGDAVRVRVGPYRQKQVAVKAQARIQEQVGLKGVVLAYRE